MSTSTITTREFLVAVINAELSADMTAKAQSLLDGLDARNAKRKSADSKERREVRARVEAVKGFFDGHKGEWFTRDQIAEAVGISGAQVTAACKALGEYITKGEAKIDKAKRVVYSLAE